MSDSSIDKEIVRRARDGDVRAFETIMRHYERGIYNLMMRMVRDAETARDLTQEVFVRVHASLGRYDPIYPFSSWIYRVATNLCIDFIRKRKLSTVSLDAPLSIRGEEVTREFPDEAPIASESLEDDERRALLEETMEKLPAPHRLVLVLRHQRDLSYEEIATALDAPLGTVKARIHRAREEFRRLLVADPRWKDFAEGMGSDDG